MVASIEAQGSENVTATKYQFIDKQILLSGKIFSYLLSDVSYSGVVTYYDPLYVFANLVPEEFGLKQNYPNPFNPSTTIQYSLPTASKVIIKIYSILGQEVLTLVDEEQIAGSYKIVWDSKNRSGNRVASGIYFYQMNAGAVQGNNRFLKNMKMTILR